MENPNKKVNDGEDRFDALPDELLTHIVSFLSFKEAARAGRLGRRWRHQWLHCRRVDLDESLFTLDNKRRLLLADSRDALAEGLRRTGRRLFLRFAAGFAQRYAEPKMESFRLVFSIPGEMQRQEVREWVRVAAARRVESIELDFSDRDADPGQVDNNYSCCELPEEVYGLRHSLRALALTGCNVQPSRLGDLHALRSLTLARTAMVEDAIEQVTSGCPLLEELYLEHLVEIEVITVTSASRRLRRLVIDDCYPVDFGIRLVDPPALRQLSFSGYYGLFEVFRVPCLEEVEIEFPEEDSVEGCEVLCRLLLDLEMVKKLTVCSYLVQVIPFDDDPFRLSATMDKLRHLTLKEVALHRDELPGIALLMRSYPQLESLTIVLTNSKKCIVAYEYPLSEVLDGASFWEKQVTIPIPCLKRHLKFVSLEGFTGQLNQIEFIRFILRAIEGLQKVNISISKVPSMYGQTIEQRQNIAQSLLLYAKTSRDVKITIE